MVLDENRAVRHVMANGSWMVKDGNPLLKGTFEN